MRHIARLLAAVTLVGAAARLLPNSLAALPWAPVVVSATPWFALTAAVSLILALAFRTKRRNGRRGHHLWGTAALMIVCLALEFAWQAAFFVPSSHALSAEASNASAAEGETSSATTLRVMTCNVYKGQASPERIMQIVRDEGVQVLALQETTSEFVEELEACGLSQTLPYAERSSSDGVYGNGVWSSVPLTDTVTDDIGSSASAMPAGTVSAADLAPSGGRSADKSSEDEGTTGNSSSGDASAPASAASAITSLRFVSVHTCAPVSGYWDLWKRSIEEIGVVRERLATDPSCAYVLMGDFNSSYDHAPFREMLGSSLFDAAREAGQGILGTWPSNTALPAFTSIDHVVVSEGIRAGDIATYTVEGSDHAALVCTLELAE